MTISPRKIYSEIPQETVDMSYSFMKNKIYLWEMKSNSTPY